MKRALAFAEAFLMMAVLQGARIGIECAVKPYFTDTDFVRRMTTAAVMILLSVCVFAYARLRKTPLSLFPKRFDKWYIIVTCVSAALLISSPSNYTGEFQPILLALYGSVVTPVYEELVFRGYLWNRLNSALKKEIFTYLWSILLFGVWHLGYMLPHFITGNYVAVAWKFAAGIGYGAVLGFIRLKTKTCYSTILAHGVMNIFMI